MWQETELDIKIGARAVFCIYTAHWCGEASGKVQFDERRGRNVVVLDCGGIYEIWNAPYYMPFKTTPDKLLKQAKLASETLWFKAGNTEKDLYDK